MSSTLLDLALNTNHVLPREYNPMHRIMGSPGKSGSLFLGNIDAAQDKELLQKHNIGAVLSVIDFHVNVDPTFKTMWIMADDHEDFPLDKYFNQAFRFIESNRETTNVLVHCYAGISRSTTICLSYLMQKYGWSLSFALRSVQSNRNIAQPNEGFIQQLSRLENRLQSQSVSGSKDNSLNTSGLSLTSFLTPRSSIQAPQQPKSIYTNRQYDTFKEIQQKIDSFKSRKNSDSVEIQMSIKKKELSLSKQSSTLSLATSPNKTLRQDKSESSFKSPIKRAEIDFKYIKKSEINLSSTKYPMPQRKTSLLNDYYLGGKQQSVSEKPFRSFLSPKSIYT